MTSKSLALTRQYIEQLQHVMQHFPTSQKNNLNLKQIPIPANYRQLHESVVQRVYKKDDQEFSGRRQAAVMALLCNHNQELSVVFTVRSSQVSTHKNQVSFPGGHIEPNEHFVDAALRETYEELGSNIGRIHVLASCQKIHAITGTIVHPVLGWLECDNATNDIGNYQHFQPNPAEVTRVFTKSIESLVRPENKSHLTYNRNMNADINKGDDQPYHIPMFFGEEEDKIWGLTAIILDSILSEVIIPTNERLRH